MKDNALEKLLKLHVRLRKNGNQFWSSQHETLQERELIEARKNNRTSKENMECIQEIANGFSKDFTQY